MRHVPKIPLPCSVLFLLCFLFFQPALATTPDSIPEMLKPWIPWVEDADKTRLCPAKPGHPDNPLCIWPHTLLLEMTNTGAHFSMDWELFSESAVPLHGSADLAPRKVRVNGEPYPQLMEKDVPVLYLKPGEYRIEGEFLWSRIPDSLQIPPEIAQARIYKNKTALKDLQRDEKGRLWLNPPVLEPDSAERRHTDFRIYRKIRDGHPLEMETRIQLMVSGDARQEVLPVPMPKNAILVEVESPLPLKPAIAEGLVLDLKPGNFTLRFVHILSGAGENLNVPDRQKEEIWVFVSSPDLRAAELLGGKSLDPRQTSLPDAWKSWAAYAMAPEAKPLIHIRESQQSPMEDEIYLERNIWLDFDGKGATVQDHLNGTLHTRSYLGMNAAGPLLPGRITYENKDRLITLHDNLQGIEVPPGTLSLTALSRMESPISGENFPIGWQNPVESQNITLHLPPGWHLAMVQGGEAGGHSSFFARWTLLDFFFLMLLSGAALKIWGLKWGLALGLSIAFFHHSFPLPMIFWFSLIATTAIGKYFVSRLSVRMLGFLSGIHILLLLAASLVALPYAADEIRTGLYPQLENLRKIQPHMRNIHFGVPQETMVSKPMNSMESIEIEFMADEMDFMADGMEFMADEMVVGSLPSPIAMMAKRASSPVSQKKEMAPPVTQTGPGVPTWQWRSIPIQTGFSGTSHGLTLHLITPLAASLAAFLRVGFVVLVLGRLATGFPYASLNIRKSTGLAVALALFVLCPALRAEAEFPPQYLLEELKEKIREQAACEPRCARSGAATLTLDAPDSKTPAFALTMELHAGSRLAFALPQTDLLLPGPELLLNDDIVPVLRWKGQNFVLLNPGVHRLRMTGPLPKEVFRLDFPLIPDALALQAPGWRVEGLSSDGRIRGLLIFRNEGEGIAKKRQEIVQEEPEVFPFVEIHRRIDREREWKVYTTLTRAYPGSRPGLVRIPLLFGETILREGLLVRDGHVEVSIPAYGRRFSWESRLPEKDTLQLRTPLTLDFGESWEIQGATDRHLSFSGNTAPPVEMGQGLLWQPLPGQSLDILFPLMPPAPGPILTAENIRLSLDAGKERRRLRLEAVIRSGKALNHTMQGPEKGILQEMLINGKIQPLPKEGEALVLDLKPGSHNLQMVWELTDANRPFLPAIIAMPEMDLGMPIANIFQEIALDRGHWLLWTYGPLLGPGVRIWGWVLLVFAGSLLLAFKADLSPLRRRDWMLLGLGLVPLAPLAILVVVAGFFIFHWRSKQTREMGGMHNFFQFGLFALLLIMAFILLAAVRNGLLGVPDMQIAGNDSNPFLLRWTADHSAGDLPAAGVLLLPLIFWRVLMFAWALWLAARVLSWAPWAWRALFRGVAWQKKSPRKAESTKAQAAETLDSKDTKTQGEADTPS